MTTPTEERPAGMSIVAWQKTLVDRKAKEDAAKKEIADAQYRHLLNNKYGLNPPGAKSPISPMVSEASSISSAAPKPAGFDLKNQKTQEPEKPQETIQAEPQAAEETPPVASNWQDSFNAKLRAKELAEGKKPSSVPQPASVSAAVTQTHVSTIQSTVSLTPQAKPAVTIASSDSISVSTSESFSDQPGMEPNYTSSASSTTTTSAKMHVESVSVPPASTPAKPTTSVRMSKEELEALIAQATKQAVDAAAKQAAAEATKQATLDAAKQAEDAIKRAAAAAKEEAAQQVSREREKAAAAEAAAEAAEKAKAESALKTQMMQKKLEESAKIAKAAEERAAEAVKNAEAGIARQVEMQKKFEAEAAERAKVAEERAKEAAQKAAAEAEKVKAEAERIKIQNAANEALQKAKAAREEMIRDRFAGLRAKSQRADSEVRASSPEKPEGKRPDVGPSLPLPAIPVAIAAQSLSPSSRPPASQYSSASLPPTHPNRPQGTRPRVHSNTFEDPEGWEEIPLWATELDPRAHSPHNARPSDRNIPSSSQSSSRPLSRDFMEHKGEREPGLHSDSPNKSPEHSRSPSKEGIIYQETREELTKMQQSSTLKPRPSSKDFSDGDKHVSFSSSVTVTSVKHEKHKKSWGEKLLGSLGRKKGDPEFQQLKEDLRQLREIGAAQNQQEQVHEEAETLKDLRKKSGSELNARQIQKLIDAPEPTIEEMQRDGMSIAQIEAAKQDKINRKQYEQNMKAIARKAYEDTTAEERATRKAYLKEIRTIQAGLLTKSELTSLKELKIKENFKAVRG